MISCLDLDRKGAKGAKEKMDALAPFTPWLFALFGDLRKLRQLDYTHRAESMCVPALGQPLRRFFTQRAAASPVATIPSNRLYFAILTTHGPRWSRSVHSLRYHMKTNLDGTIPQTASLFKPF